MTTLTIGSSFISPPHSSIFPTKFIASRKNKSLYVACESSKNHLKNSHNFHPNGRCSPETFAKDYEDKVDNLKRLLKSKEDEDPTESLPLIDAIQRLGVSRHYQEEIHTILDRHYLKNGHGILGCHSLHDVALSFRLLRQRGYRVSADVFNNFTGKDGRFDVELRQDIRGLLELYEATQLSYQGENILDEAEDFSSQLLYESLSSNQYKWSNIVNTRLKHPYHKSITRLTENKFLRDLQGINGWAKPLTELAKMDFVIGQSIHTQELLQISKWWDDLGLTKELKLARNQPLKWYTWSMSILIDDVSLSAQRVELTKSIAFIYLIDDIFDLYGTPQELAIFTEAVHKWEYAAMDVLPDYMKISYKALLDTINEIGLMIREKHGYNPINSLKQTWGSLCNAFLVEAKWFASHDLPSPKEYLDNGKVSSGVHVVLVHLFFLLGLDANHLDDASRLISSVAAILRLWDDLGSAKDEHQNGKDGSYIECYMKDRRGLSFKQAREDVVSMISVEWKRLNYESFRLHNLTGLSFQEASLNLARMVSLMYSYDDNQRLPVLDEYISFMLLNHASLDHHSTKQEHLV